MKSKIICMFCMMISILGHFSGLQQVNAQVELEVAFPHLSFSRPVDLQYPPDGSNRLFVVEQQGIIYSFQNIEEAATKKVFLNIQDQVNDSGNEEGLLGLAFHPDYQDNGYFFVDYTAADPARTVIARYQVSASDPDSAVKASEFVILEVSQPYSNHNAGQILFGPDGYFYITFGDGGSGGDPQGNGQDLQTLLGSIIRIDVDHPDMGLNYGIPSDNPFADNENNFREEIYAYGLRNPWRISFDPHTQWLWAADVGQNAYEEIDIIKKGNNYGWNIMEGLHCYNASSCDTSGLTMPIWEYDHSMGRSITGGYVYRGSDVQELAGKYVYADYVSGRIWALEYDGTGEPVNTLLMDTNLFISSFGVDQNNELYICAFDGKIYQFIPVTGIDQGSNRRKSINFRLGQNYPNPFNSSTVIRYRLDNNTKVVLQIHNLTGNLVKTLVNRNQSTGDKLVVWNGRDQKNYAVNSGIYFYTLKGKGFKETRKMLVLN